MSGRWMAAGLGVGAVVLLLLWFLGAFEPGTAANAPGVAPTEGHTPEAAILVGRASGGAGPDPIPDSSAAPPDFPPPPPIRTVRCLVTRRGVPAKGLTVQVIRTDGVRSTASQVRRLSDARGECAFQEVPGDCLVEVGPRPGHTQPHPFAKVRRLSKNARAWLVRAPVQVPEDRDPDVVQLELPGTEISVAVIDSSTGRAIEGADVYIQRKDGGTKDDLIAGAFAKSDAGGGAEVLDLPWGTYAVTALTDRHAAPEPVEVVLTEREPDHPVELLLQPGGHINVRIVNAAGEPQPISMAFAPRVRSQATGTYHPLARANSAGIGEEPRHVSAPRVPVGRYVVSVKDHITVDVGVGTPGVRQYTIRYQPTDEIHLNDVRVQPGEVTTVDLPVAYRAYVNLAGTSQGDTPDRNLAVSVTKDAGRPRGIVRIQPAAWSGGSAFTGYLAPGIYTVQLRHRDGRSWTETLVVERENIEKTFRAPWSD